MGSWETVIWLLKNYRKESITDSTRAAREGMRRDCIRKGFPRERQILHTSWMTEVEKYCEWMVQWLCHWLTGKPRKKSIFGRKVAKLVRV